MHAATTDTDIPLELRIHRLRADLAALERELECHCAPHTVFRTPANDTPPRPATAPSTSAPGAPETPLPIAAG